MHFIRIKYVLYVLRVSVSVQRESSTAIKSNRRVNCWWPPPLRRLRIQVVVIPFLVLQNICVCMCMCVFIYVELSFFTVHAATVLCTQLLLFVVVVDVVVISLLNKILTTLDTTIVLLEQKPRQGTKTRQRVELQFFVVVVLNVW